MSTQGGPAGVGALVLAEDVLRACFLEPMAPSYIKIGRNHVCITSGPERETNKLVPITVEIFFVSLPGEHWGMRGRDIDA